MIQTYIFIYMHVYRERERDLFFASEVIFPDVRVHTYCVDLDTFEEIHKNIWFGNVLGLPPGDSICLPSWCFQMIC